MTNLPATLDSGKLLAPLYSALADVQTALEAQDVADAAGRAKVMAGAAGLPGVAVQCGNIQQRAERKVAQFTPPTPHEEKNPEGYVTSEVTYPQKKQRHNEQKRVSDIRKAHDNLTDAEFERLLAEATEKGKPLTRKALLSYIKKRDNKAKQADLETNPLPLPVRKYATIVIDPPWDIQKIERDVRPNQHALDYPAMTIEAIKGLELPTADDALVFCWTTVKFLPNTFDILKAWGLKYRFTMVWHKPGGFQPVGLPQYNVEFVVVGAKGNPTFTDTKAFNLGFNAPRGQHSEKPEEFYDLLRRVTYGPRLDMFNRRPIDDFDSWGDQA